VPSRSHWVKQVDTEHTSCRAIRLLRSIRPRRPIPVGLVVRVRVGRG